MRLHEIVGAKRRGKSWRTTRPDAIARRRPDLAQLAATIQTVAPGDVHVAFATAAAADGIVLGHQSFDWLCEQGHVGLERVA
jgi:hypothetical protein